MEQFGGRAEDERGDNRPSVVFLLLRGEKGRKKRWQKSGLFNSLT